MLDVTQALGALADHECHLLRPAGQRAEPLRAVDLGTRRAQGRDFLQLPLAEAEQCLSA